MKPRLREAVLVEGRYDKNTLLQVVDATVFVCGGFGILQDKQMLSFLRQVANKRGLVIFTDSDGAGFVIRNRLKSQLPRENLLHAYIPDVPGKEGRKTRPSKEGLLGVEGMTPEIILEALRRSGAHFLDECGERPAPSISRQDLFTLGLMGGPDSKILRDRVKIRLGLPAHLGTSGFLDALNLITDQSGLEQILKEEST